jgi:hypothetical protein
MHHYTPSHDPALKPLRTPLADKHVVGSRLFDITTVTSRHAITLSCRYSLRMLVIVRVLQLRTLVRPLHSNVVLKTLHRTFTTYEVE